MATTGTLKRQRGGPGSSGKCAVAAGMPSTPAGVVIALANDPRGTPSAIERGFRLAFGKTLQQHTRLAQRVTRDVPTAVARPLHSFAAVPSRPQGRRVR